MNTNNLIKITILVLLIFVLTGCETRSLPIQVSDEIEKFSGSEVAVIIAADGKTGNIEIFKHSKTEEKHSDNVPISKIEKITSIFVARVTGVKREDIDENYQFCNYITIDGNTDLICKNNEIQESDQSQGIQNIPPELVTQLEEFGKKVNNLSFVALVGIEKGETKIFKNANYEQVLSALPQSISEIQKSTSINVINGKKNPCIQQIIVGGESVTVYRRDINC